MPHVMKTSRGRGKEEQISLPQKQSPHIPKLTPQCHRSKAISIPKSITGKGKGMTITSLELINQDLPPGSGRVSAVSEHTASWKMNQGPKEATGEFVTRGHTRTLEWQAESPILSNFLFSFLFLSLF